MKAKVIMNRRNPEARRQGISAKVVRKVGRKDKKEA